MKKKSFMFFVAVVMSLLFAEQAFSEDIIVDGKIYRLEKMVSQYYTTFDPNKKSRTNNILLASLSINGLIIKPGEVISFNEKVGPRTKEAGFMKAGAFANGKKITSFGGGICQVASTWSAASIKLKLNILERHRHSLPVNYIARKYEATVSYGTKDFKIQNTSNDILFVKCFVKDGKYLYVEYWRCKEV